MLTGGLAMPMGGLARIVPGRGTNFLHRTSRTSTDFSVRLDFSSAGEIRPQFGWICNPAVVNIRIFNPGFALLIALQMLIFNTVGLQIRPNGKSDRTGTTLGVGLGATLGVGNSKDNQPDNQTVKCRVCWVSPTVCQHVGAGVRVYGLTSIVRDYKSQYSKQLDFRSALPLPQGRKKSS